MRTWRKLSWHDFFIYAIFRKHACLINNPLTGLVILGFYLCLCNPGKFHLSHQVLTIVLIPVFPSVWMIKIYCYEGIISRGSGKRKLLSHFLRKVIFFLFFFWLVTLENLLEMGFIICIDALISYTHFLSHRTGVLLSLAWNSLSWYSFLISVLLNETFHHYLLILSLFCTHISVEHKRQSFENRLVHSAYSHPPDVCYLNL